MECRNKTGVPARKLIQGNLFSLQIYNLSFQFLMLFILLGFIILFAFSSVFHNFILSQSHRNWSARTLRENGCFSINCSMGWKISVCLGFVALQSPEQH